jgi:hypothetical protein
MQASRTHSGAMTDLAGKFGRSVATPAEARRILGLRAA